MDELILKIISKLDEHVLTNSAGPSIVRSVSESFNVSLREDLAKIVCYKYGPRILKELSIRTGLINTSTIDEIRKLAADAGIPNCDGEEWLAYKNVKAHFKSPNVKKLKIFASWLGLSEDYASAKTKDTRSDQELITITHGQSAELKGYLHPYQKNVKDQIYAFLKVDSSRAMVQMPTGSGKTYTALESIVDVLRQPDRPGDDNFIVWIVDSNELAEQALEAFRGLWEKKGDKEINCFRLFKNFIPRFQDHASGIVFASFDIIFEILKEEESKGEESQRQRDLKYLISKTNCLFVDEAHASTAKTYLNCISKFLHRSNNDDLDRGPKLIGLTATPFRKNDEIERQLEQTYKALIEIKDENNVTVDKTINYLQDREFLAHVDMKTLGTGLTYGKQQDERKLLKELAEDSARNEMIVDTICASVKDKKQVLVFACTVDHAFVINLLCKQKKLKVDYITGDVLQEERLVILEKFRNHKINVIINHEILSTGIDIPTLDQLIITRPVKSDILYSQIAGRALRGPLNGGNKCNSIINVVDNISRYESLQELYDKFRTTWGG